MIQRHHPSFVEKIMSVCVHISSPLSPVSIMCYFYFFELKHKCQAVGRASQQAFNLGGRTLGGCPGSMPQTVVTWCLKATCCCCFCMLHIFQTQELWEIMTAAAGQMTLVIFSSFSISISLLSPNLPIPPLRSFCSNQLCRNPVQ